MRWALKLGEVAGIGIFVHWTFLLLIGWILYSHLSEGEGIRLALVGVGFVLAVFTCIVLHELGHALTALRFGIRTRDITLLPIGGVARLEHIPEEPMQEFLVAIAGPAVNVVIAIVLATVLAVTGGFTNLSNLSVGGGNFLLQLLVVNLGLVAFNLIPAFPMDGGRILRALLTPLMGRLRATDTAASVGQFIAIVFGIVGLFGHGMLIFIALFIYLGAQQEAQMAHILVILHGVPVREAMITSFRTLTADARLDTAVRQLLSGDQKDFPVLENGRIVGMLRSKTVFDLGADLDSAALVGDLMQRDCKPVEETAMLQEVFEQMRHDDCSTLPVVRRGLLVGIVSLENIGAWLMIQSARKARGSSREGLTRHGSA